MGELRWAIEHWLYYCEFLFKKSIEEIVREYSTLRGKLWEKWPSRQNFLENVQKQNYKRQSTTRQVVISVEFINLLKMFLYKTCTVVWITDCYHNQVECNKHVFASVMLDETGSTTFTWNIHQLKEGRVVCMIKRALLPTQINAPRHDLQTVNNHKFLTLSKIK